MSVSLVRDVAKQHDENHDCVSYRRTHAHFRLDKKTYARTHARTHGHANNFTRKPIRRNLVVFLLNCELQAEHTEGVRKLNFVLSLTDAILEVISARGTPLTVLADSVAIKQVSVLYMLLCFTLALCSSGLKNILYHAV